MKIGITERGDAGIDFTWEQKVSNLDGIILITKSVNKIFRQKVLLLHSRGLPIIIHCTCTGWGGTAIEPCVPTYQTQLQWMKELIQDGFPAQNIVLRVDPIFPTLSGLSKVKELLNYFVELNSNLAQNIERIRVSVLDEYRHVKQRFIQHGYSPIYGNSLFASDSQIQDVANLLNSFAHNNTMFRIETCAETSLSRKLDARYSQCTGCVSMNDIKIMGLSLEGSQMFENPQNRKGCHCLSCKTELLENKHPCAHKCMYCYWI